MPYFDNQQPEKCEGCIYKPGTHDYGCSFDCDAMGKGYLVVKPSAPFNYGVSNLDNVVPIPDSDFPAGHTYPASDQFGTTDNQGRVVVNTKPVPLFSGFTMNRKGWICPRCDMVVSPDEKTCPNCKPKPKEEKADGNPTRLTE